MKKLYCIAPEICKLIEIYNNEASLPLASRKLSTDERILAEMHLIVCCYCRKKLDSRGLIKLMTKLVLSGFFLDDVNLLKDRRKIVHDFLCGALETTDLIGKNWLRIGNKEWYALLDFLSEGEI